MLLAFPITGIVSQVMRNQIHFEVVCYSISFIIQSRLKCGHLPSRMMTYESNVGLNETRLFIYSGLSFSLFTVKQKKFSPFIHHKIFLNVHHNREAT